MSSLQNYFVRKMTIPEVELVIHYWQSSSDEHMTDMGVDVKKKPSEELMRSFISKNIHAHPQQALAYYLTWLYNNKPVGYSNINQIKYGEQAYMHLHIWDKENRKKGMGSHFIKLSALMYMKVFKLQRLYCEPYALNPAPNKAVAKAGFSFVKKHVTTPGASNFKQEVNLWVITQDKLKSIKDH